MKPGEGCRSGAPEMPLPRQKCRGLIEAAREAALLNPRFALFPGRNAGASLKQRHESDKHSVKGSLPRQKCRGLIEAGDMTGGLWKGLPPLPRQKCRGLIEAAASGASSTPRWALFPGRNAGASLKPFVEHMLDAIEPALPRQKCRGLIEARGWDLAGAGAGCSSPAEMPGPH